MSQLYKRGRYLQATEGRLSVSGSTFRWRPVFVESRFLVSGSLFRLRESNFLGGSLPIVGSVPFKEFKVLEPGGTSEFQARLFNEPRFLTPQSSYIISGSTFTPTKFATPQGFLSEAERLKYFPWYQLFGNNSIANSEYAVINKAALGLTEGVEYKAEVILFAILKRIEAVNFPFLPLKVAYKGRFFNQRLNQNFRTEVYKIVVSKSFSRDAKGELPDSFDNDLTPGNL